jgi:homocysteine S-methyltransferase
VPWQATLPGFQSRGLSREQSEELLRRSVQIAQEARAIFLEGRSKGPYAARENNDGSTERRQVLVAASVGSYGAYLADGSEYTYENSKNRSTPPARDSAHDLLYLIDVSV